MSSYTSLYYHIVFGTKLRKPLLVDSLRADVCKYMAGIVTNKDGHLIEIGGIDDHLHLLASCSPKRALAEFIRDVKANSSKWINEQSRFKDFAWQPGYGAFTVSISQLEVVQRYIRNQTEHHRRQSFADEFRALLRKHKIAFDEARLFDDEFHG